jgi:N-acetylmuramoyl-L-alanine amidase
VTARVDAPGPPTRATIDIAPAAAVTSVIENGRVLIRVYADALDLALPSSSSGLIEQIRAADAPNTIALVLQPTAGLPRVTPSTADNVTRVVIDVPAAAGAPAGAPVDTAATPPRPETPPVDTSALTSPRPVLQTIVIDPGHGGEDVGAKGAGGTQEKQLTLEIARRLRAAIEMRLGMRVILTRDEDRSVQLDERASIANNSKADLFLSLHANAALAAAPAGAEVYHLRLDREGEEARREAAADAVTMPILGGGTRKIDVIRWDLAQARHIDTSAALAGMLATDLGSHITMSPRAVQQAPLRVLEGADMPAALIEMAYLTNPAQEKLAATDEYRNAIVQSVFDTIVKFRSYLEERRAQ